MALAGTGGLSQRDAWMEGRRSRCDALTFLSWWSDHCLQWPLERRQREASICDGITCAT